MKRYLSLLALLLFGCMHAARPPPTLVQTDYRPASAQALSATVLVDTSDGYGAGIAWDSTTIVTAKHVIWPPEVPTITTRSGDECEVLSTTYALYEDIAVIKVRGCTLFPIRRASGIAQGAKVWAAGHPLGRRWSVSHGVVMRMGHRLELDSIILPGMSGGPVVDASGRLVGMCVSVAIYRGAVVGMGYAIKVEDLERIVAYA